MDIVSFRSVLVLGGLCFIALIVCAIAEGSHQKTRDIGYSFGVFLMLATFGMTAVWILKVGTHGVLYLVHEVQAEKNQKEEQQQSKEEAERREREEKQAKWNAISENDHLRIATQLLKVGAPPGDIDEAKRHMNAVTSKRGKSQMQALFADYERKQAVETKKAAESERRARAMLNRAARDVFVRVAETHFLDEGLDVTVVATGADHTTLRMTNVLFNRVSAYQLGKSGLINSAQNIGFHRIELSNGYDYSVYWKLDAIER